VLDYEFLKIIWWVLIGIVLVVYATTAGYDSGVTMIMPFLRREDERRVMLNTSAPTWDGNQTWIVFAGGGLFVVWPVVYSTAFSGMYAALLCILWSLFFRPPGYDYRSKLPHMAWRRFWDFGLFISSVVPVFMFGLIFGNCFLGMPFHFDHVTFRAFFTRGFAELFSPFAVLCGFVSLAMILMHGSSFTMRRTEGSLRAMARKLHFVFSILLLISFTWTGYWVTYHIAGYQLISSPVHPTLHPLDNVVTQQVGAWVLNYDKYPWKYFGPIFSYVGIFASLWANYVRWVAFCFWASAFAIGGLIVTAGSTLFPFIMPSSTYPDESLTVWNSTSSQYALNLMLYVGVVLLLAILAYKIYTFHAIWSKKATITVKDLHDNEHTFY
jgi:cytochrome d ubiquinol oxidase subunit II